jgi:hypothetical protein
VATGPPVGAPIFPCPDTPHRPPMATTSESCRPDAARWSGQAPSSPLPHGAPHTRPTSPFLSLPAIEVPLEPLHLFPSPHPFLCSARACSASPPPPPPASCPSPVTGDPPSCQNRTGAPPPPPSVSFTRAPPLFDSGYLSRSPLLHGVVGNLSDRRRPMAASLVDRTPPATTASTPSMRTRHSGERRPPPLCSAPPPRPPQARREHIVASKPSNHW